MFDLGFIHIQPLHGGVRVDFNPSRVARKAMISAFYVIAGEAPKRIALSYESQCSRLELFGAVAAAFCRIEELIAANPPTTPVISQRRRPLDHLSKLNAGPLIELLRAWSDAAGHWTPELRANLCTAVYLEDTMIIRNPRGSNRLVNDHWGANFDYIGLHWPKVARQQGC